MNPHECIVCGELGCEQGQLHFVTKDEVAKRYLYSRELLREALVPVGAMATDGLEEDQDLYDKIVEHLTH